MWTDLKKIILSSHGFKSQPKKNLCFAFLSLPHCFLDTVGSTGGLQLRVPIPSIPVVKTWPYQHLEVGSCRAKKRKPWPQLQTDRLCLRVARLLHERNTNYWAHNKASFAISRFWVDWCSVQWRGPDHLSFDVGIHGQTKENLEGDADLVDCSAGSSSVHSLQCSRRVGSNSRFVLHSYTPSLICAPLSCRL